MVGVCAARARARDEVDTRRLDGCARCPASVPRRCSSDAIYHPTARDSRRRPRGVDAPMATLGGGHALALSVESLRPYERARPPRRMRLPPSATSRRPPRGVRHRIPRDVALPRRGHAVRGLLGRGVEGAERRPRRCARRREPRNGDRRDGARARGGRARDHRARQVRDGGERIPTVASTGWARRGGSAAAANARKEEELEKTQWDLYKALGLTCLCLVTHTTHHLHHFGLHEYAHGSVLTALGQPWVGGAIAALALWAPGGTSCGKGSRRSPTARRT